MECRNGSQGHRNYGILYGADICALLDRLKLVLTEIRDKLSDVSHFAVSGTCSDINRCTSRPIENTEASQE